MAAPLLVIADAVSVIAARPVMVPEAPSVAVPALTEPRSKPTTVFRVLLPVALPLVLVAVPLPETVARPSMVPPLPPTVSRSPTRPLAVLT